MEKTGLLKLGFGLNSIELENTLRVRNAKITVPLNRSQINTYNIDKTFESDPFTGPMLVLDYKQNTPFEDVSNDAYNIRKAADNLGLNRLEIGIQEPDKDRAFPRLILSSFDLEIN